MSTSSAGSAAAMSPCLQHIQAGGQLTSPHSSRRPGRNEEKSRSGSELAADYRAAMNTSRRVGCVIAVSFSQHHQVRLGSGKQQVPQCDKLAADKQADISCKRKATVCPRAVINTNVSTETVVTDAVLRGMGMY